MYKMHTEYLSIYVSLFTATHVYPSPSYKSLLYTHFYLFWCVSQKVYSLSTEKGSDMAGRREEVLRQEETGTHSLFMLEVER